MNLADYIESNKDRLIERWKHYAVERLSLKLEESELLNDLPTFIDDMVQVFRSPPDDRPAIDSARQHGQHRMRSGIDTGGLTEEMVLMSETIIELAHEDGKQPSGNEVLLLMRMIARGAATSVAAYAAMRDDQLAKQAARHFSFVAHEIRNPLYNARLAADLLAQDSAESEVHLQALDAALNQLTDLVDNSLLQARFVGEHDLQLQRLEVRQLIDAACRDVALQARRRGIDVAVEATPFDLDGDRRLLVSALTNLLKNAVHFSCDSGHVVVRARPVDERVLFEVEDQCGGIAEEKLQRLFQPYVQLGDDSSGFGLGLAIVKQAAESHGGAVRVVNRAGEGCCFVLDLPHRQSQPDAEADRQA
jgi:signal transduction histidine kinase